MTLEDKVAQLFVVMPESLVPEVNPVTAAGDATRQAYEEGKGIGYYLRDLGFNVDFAPVADVLSNPNNLVIGTRSFGSDAGLVTQMAEATTDL